MTAPSSSPSSSSSSLRILIVDDEAPARSRLRELLADIAEDTPLHVLGEAATGFAALDFIQATPVDVVLLDIRMPQMDGIEVAQHLARMESPPAIVFATAYDDYAIRAFELHAVDYLLKPIRTSRLREALARVRPPHPPGQDALRDLRESQKSARSNLSIQERGKIMLIPITDIVFLRAELKYVTVKTVAREYLLEESLLHLESEFSARFVRIHRNCLVARDWISGFERVADEAGETHWAVLLRDLPEKLPVSRRQQHVVKELGKN